MDTFLNDRRKDEESDEGNEEEKATKSRINEWLDIYIPEICNQEPEKEKKQKPKPDCFPKEAIRSAVKKIRDQKKVSFQQVENSENTEITGLEVDDDQLGSVRKKFF